MPPLVCASPACWPQLHSSILRYASQIPGISHGRLILMSHLENLLERVRKQHAHRSHRRCLSEPRRMSWGRSRDDHQGPSYDLVPWDDLLVLCINQKLQDWPSPGPPVCQGQFAGFKAPNVGGFEPLDILKQA